MNEFLKVFTGIVLVSHGRGIVGTVTIDDQSVCSDCCDLLSCLGLQNSYFANLTSPQKFIEDMCSERHISSLHGCYNSHNLQHCSYLKDVAVHHPAENYFVKGLAEYCSKRKNETVALTNCIVAHRLEKDVSIKCSKPYFDGMKDQNSDPCLVFDDMTSCMLEMLKATNCSRKVSLDFAEQMREERQKIQSCSSMNVISGDVTVTLGIVISVFILFC